MLEENITDQEELKPGDNLFEENRTKWINSLAHLAVNGEPFMVDGMFTMRIEADNDLIDIHIKRVPNNIIPFPTNIKKDSLKKV